MKKLSGFKDRLNIKIKCLKKNITYVEEYINRGPLCSEIPLMIKGKWAIKKLLVSEDRSSPRGISVAEHDDCIQVKFNAKEVLDYYKNQLKISQELLKEIEKK